MLVELCPKCGSNKVKNKQKVRIYGQRVEVECMSCGWKGDDSELLVSKLGEDASLTDVAMDITKEAVTNFGELLGKGVAPPLVYALVHSGLVAAADTELLQELATESIEAIWERVVKILKDKDKKNAEQHRIDPN